MTARASLHRGVPTSLRKPSSLAGLQVRATKAGSWAMFLSLASPPYLILARLDVRTPPSKKFSEPEADVECTRRRELITFLGGASACGWPDGGERLSGPCSGYRWKDRV